MNPNRLSKVLVALRKYNPDHTGLILLLEEALKSGPGSEFFNRAFDNLIKSPGFRLPPEAGSPENFRDELTKTSTTTWMELQNQEQETKASAQLEQEIEKENEKKEEIKKEKRRVPRPSVPEEAKRLEKAVEKEVIKNMSDDRTNEAYQMSEKTIFDNWVKEQRKKGKEPSTIEECRKNEEFIEKVDDHFKKSQKDFKKNFEAEKRRVYKNPNDDPLIKEYKKILAEFRDRNQDEKNKRISIRGLRKVFKEYFSEKADGYDVRSEVKTTGEQAGSLPKAEVFEDVPIETIPHQPVSLKGSRISEIPKTSGEIPKVELKPISSAVRVPQAGEIASPTSVFRGMFGRVPFVGRFFGAGAGAGAGGAGAGAAAGATTAATTTAGTGAAAAVATSEIWIPILIAILIFLLLVFFIFLGFKIHKSGQEVISVTKSADKNKVPNPVVGSSESNITYTIKVGSSKAQTFTLIDPIPEGTEFIAATGNYILETDSSGVVTAVKWSMSTGDGENQEPPSSGNPEGLANLINENILKSTGLEGLGQTVVDASNNYNVPWALGLAILKKENSFYGNKSACLVQNQTNNPGSLNWGDPNNNGKCKEDSLTPERVAKTWCKDRYYCEYPTLEDGTQAVYAHLNRTDVDGVNYRQEVDLYLQDGNPLHVLNHYAPPVENNTSQYAQQMADWIKEWENLAEQNGIYNSVEITTTTNDQLAVWLDKKLTEKPTSSGLRGMGKTLVQQAAIHNVPVELALGMFWLETRWYSDDGATVRNNSNNPGNILCTELRLGAINNNITDRLGNHYCTFASLEKGIEAYFVNLDRELYRSAVNEFISTGNPEPVIKIYYDPGNDPSGGSVPNYVKTVNTIVKQLRDDAAKDGISLTPSGNNTSNPSKNNLEVTLTVRPKLETKNTYVYNQAFTEGGISGGGGGGTSSCTGGKTITLDPGHPANDGKNTGVVINGELVEEKINLAIANALKPKLESMGFTVVMTENSLGVNLNNDIRAKIANDANSSLFFRIHANSTASSVRGYFFMTPDGIYDSKTLTTDLVSKSNQAASTIMNALEQAKTGLPRKGDGLESDGFGGNSKNGLLDGSRYSKVPVTLIEMGNLNNKQDYEWLFNATNQDKLADALAKGISAFTGNSVCSTEQTKSTPSATLIIKRRDSFFSGKMPRLINPAFASIE